MAYRLRCPVCRGVFPFDPDMERYPEYCRLKACGVYIGSGRSDTDIVMPFVRAKDLMKKTDQVYRDIESASERRADQAAEMAGVPVSEMSGLKVTNLQDARHQGDIAAMPVNNAVSRFMEQNKVGGFQQGVEFSGAVTQGPHPNVGAKMRTTLQSHHAALMGGSAVSDRPAIETQQPGYRRRG